LLPNLGAAKIQVLGLAALKNTLGPKWNRLSGLVHRLFETAAGRVQGPRDHFIAVDELSYVVTFADLTVAETELACQAIAREICRMLFGEQIDEISIRSLVSGIVAPDERDPARFASRVQSQLEISGKEIVVTQSIVSGAAQPVVSVSDNVSPPRLPPVEEIARAHAVMGELGFDLAFAPVWELKKGTSSTLFLAPQSGNARGRRVLDGIDQPSIAQSELVLLGAAAAYAGRIHKAGRICAVGVGVSYQTLSVLQSRIAYITALQKLRMPASTPLVLKIEQIPEGTPVSRIADLVSMLRFQSMRVILEFCCLGSMPELDMQIGAAGFGGPLPKGATSEAAARLSEKLVNRTVSQRGFTFLEWLGNSELVQAVRTCGIRFGTGPVFGNVRFSGLEAVPEFPLVLAASLVKELT
jgi:hypothetical protein